MTAKENTEISKFKAILGTAKLFISTIKRDDFIELAISPGDETELGEYAIVFYIEDSDGVSISYAQKIVVEAISSKSTEGN